MLHERCGCHPPKVHLLCGWLKRKPESAWSEPTWSPWFQVQQSLLNEWSQVLCFYCSPRWRPNSGHGRSQWQAENAISGKVWSGQGQVGLCCSHERNPFRCRSMQQGRRGVHCWRIQWQVNLSVMWIYLLAGIVCHNIVLSKIRPAGPVVCREVWCRPQQMEFLSRSEDQKVRIAASRRCRGNTFLPWRIRRFKPFGKLREILIREAEVEKNCWHGNPEI